MKHAPNALTLLRLVLAPVIAWLFWEGATTLDVPHELSQHSYEIGTTNLIFASVLFAVAAITDLFDGMIARAFNVHSKFGRLIDPIADKALVGLPLIAIVFAMWDAPYPITFSPNPIVVTIAVAVIVFRDVLMTWIRLSAPDGEGAPVSSLAKVKTALELFVVGGLIVGAAIKPHLWSAMHGSDDGAVFLVHLFDAMRLIWLALLVITAALSAYTALQYLRPKR